MPKPWNSPPPDRVIPPFFNFCFYFLPSNASFNAYIVTFSPRCPPAKNYFVFFLSWHRPLHPPPGGIFLPRSPRHGFIIFWFSLIALTMTSPKRGIPSRPPDHANNCVVVFISFFAKTGIRPAPPSSPTQAIFSFLSLVEAPPPPPPALIPPRSGSPKLYLLFSFLSLNRPWSSPPPLPPHTHPFLLFWLFSHW